MSSVQSFRLHLVARKWLFRQVKQRYDPSNRFNCWHCLGYQGPSPFDTNRSETGTVGAGRARGEASNAAVAHVLWLANFV